MGLFNSRRPRAPESLQKPANVLPMSQFDFGKRYDVYCSVIGEDRLYENVRLITVRSFTASEWAWGEYLEIESTDGSGPLLIPRHSIQIVCEHGTQPVFKVLRRHGGRWQY